jgi:hypothetical protein
VPPELIAQRRSETVRRWSGGWEVRPGLLQDGQYAIALPPRQHDKLGPHGVGSESDIQALCIHDAPDREPTKSVPPAAPGVRHGHRTRADEVVEGVLVPNVIRQ